MDDGIIYECNSINNKKIRRGELKILEKHEEGLYFIFGESNVSAKKRYYEDLETLNKDFEALLKLKEEEENEEKEILGNEIKEVIFEEFKDFKELEEPEKEEETEEVKEELTIAMDKTPKKKESKRNKNNRKTKMF